MPRSRTYLRIAAVVILALVAPLWLPSFGVEVAAMQAPLVALGAGVLLVDAGWLALAAAAAAGALVAWRPDGAWELAALGLAPAAIAGLAHAWRDARGRTALHATIAASAIVLAGLGLAQRAGAPLLRASMAAVAGDDSAATATLGNPNHLAGWLVIALPLIVGGPATQRWQRALRLVASVTATAGVVATGSHLGLIALVILVGLALAALRPQPLRTAAVAAAIGAVVLAAIVVVALAPAARDQLAGRAYLAEVQLADKDITEWLVGAGPGHFDREFLAAQAAWLADHPGDRGRWTNPGFPHDDVVGLLGLLGAPAVLALIAVGRWRLRWQPALPGAAAVATPVMIGLVAVGSTVVWFPALWALAMIGLAAVLAPRAAPSVATRSRRLAAGLVAASWVLVLTAAWCADGLRGRALDRATRGDLDAALVTIRGATALPFGSSRRAYVEGRVLLERGDAAAALAPLRTAAEGLPHPTVLRALALAEERAYGATSPATADRLRRSAGAPGPAGPAEPGTTTRRGGGSR